MAPPHVGIVSDAGMTGLELESVGIGRLDDRPRIDRHAVFDDGFRVLHDESPPADTNEDLSPQVVARAVPRMGCPLPRSTRCADTCQVTAPCSSGGELVIRSPEL